MGFGFLASGIVKEKIRDRLLRNGEQDLFTPNDLNLAAERFEAVATNNDQ